MAFNGKLLEVKVGNSYSTFPTNLVNAESYKVTPDQRMESSANRASSGKLIRQTVEHTATKIDFSTTILTNSQLATITSLLASAYTDTLQRKLDARYYDPTTDSYKEGTFYVPDIDYEILRIDKTNNVIWYNSIRYAFIEY